MYRDYVPRTGPEGTYRNKSITKTTNKTQQGIRKKEESANVRSCGKLVPKIRYLILMYLVMLTYSNETYRITLLKLLKSWFHQVENEPRD